MNLDVENQTSMADNLRDAIPAVALPSQDPLPLLTRTITVPDRGRSVIAAVPIPRGTLLHASPRTVLIPDSGCRRHLCAACVPIPTRSLLERELVVSCEGCRFAAYCSTSCRDVDRSLGHGVECEGLRELRGLLEKGLVTEYMVDYAWLLVKLIVRVGGDWVATRGARERTSDASGDLGNADATDLPPFMHIWEFCTNAEHVQDRLRTEFAWVATVMATVVAKGMPETLRDLDGSGMQWPEEDDPHILAAADDLLDLDDTLAQPGTASPAGHGLLRTLRRTLSRPLLLRLLSFCLSLICKEECNSFGLYNYVRSGAKQPRQSYGLAFLSTSIMFNHDCEPNVGHVVRRLEVEDGSGPAAPARLGFAFYACRDIEVGEELCITYLEAWMGVGVRRKALRELFSFDCGCKRCEKELGGLSEKDNGKMWRLGEYLCGDAGCKGFFVPSSLGARVPGSVDSKLDVVVATADSWSCEACGRERPEMRRDSASC
ncbi:hypothetical protein HK101_001744 [Irineochytrium annulatum]|nr:hypothetical protein HK101_001744 [Irineochytrium annulatum]